MNLYCVGIFTDELGKIPGFLCSEDVKRNAHALGVDGEQEHGLVQQFSRNIAIGKAKGIDGAKASANGTGKRQFFSCKFPADVQRHTGISGLVGGFRLMLGDFLPVVFLSSEEFEAATRSGDEAAFWEDVADAARAAVDALPEDESRGYWQDFIRIYLDDAGGMRA